MKNPKFNNVILEIYSRLLEEKLAKKNPKYKFCKNKRELLKDKEKIKDLAIEVMDFEQYGNWIRGQQEKYFGVTFEEILDAVCKKFIKKCGKEEGFETLSKRGKDGFAYENNDFSMRNNN